MGITISAVVLLLVVVAILLRTGSLRFGPALAAVLLGFFLASTGIAPAVNNALSSLATAIAQITA
ncbi:hypothetical protein ACFV2V_29820 [Streptomyces sp. NPDC059698]|uniref:hypothetical protein n=1 Tax=Streptomyces TaxID=1883 RepID=UPI00093B3756|nr:MULTISPECIES: hypothetical protein [unclassified Streptomyces]OKJ29655.1 hypothetical protein AMK24_29560 [Streptomyces sp. CB02366]HWU10551.1 hypothetical protein [Streptomyces sp.]